jgi:hypothetical protein
MFKRTKSEPATPATPAKADGKGRPTPTRKEAEAAAKARAKAPRTRRELAEAQRRQRTSANQRMREAMKTGDDRYLPARDKGPVKRFVRDFVDRRFSVVELLIPLLVVSLILGWSGRPALVSASSLVLMVTVLFVVVDMLVLIFRLRRQLAQRFPGQSTRGTAFYAATRAMQMKFMRLPKARVKVGQDLPDDYDR